MSQSVSYEMVERSGGDIESSGTNVQKVHTTTSWKTAGKHSITWKNLAWEVNVKKLGSSSTQKKVLKGVSGYIESGNILAIMGPSGSGKTSLLDILADRAGSGVITGEILLDGKPRTPEYVANYVSQEDSLLGAFTTKETLMYTAGLTLKTDVTVAQREALVADLIRSLGLEVCANTRIGDVFTKGLSGGQKRRLSLGLSLISRPVLLLLDEPTSGLDAASAQGIMKLISHLATEKNIAIACTIHQPSSDIWKLFDKLSLMVAGEQVYFGAAHDTVSYFSSIGHECPAYSNPGDYCLTLINTDYEGHADVPVLVDEFQKHQEPLIDARIASINAEGSVTSIFTNMDRNNSFNQFLFLVHRNFTNTYRNPGVIMVRLVMYAMLSIMIGGMFWENGSKTTDKAIQGRIACLFFVFAFMVFMSIAVLPFYMWDRTTYLRERFNGDYAVFPFVAAQFISTVPGVFMIALVSSIIVVFMCEWENFGYFLLIMFLSLMTAEGYMAFLSAVVPHFIIGIAFGAGMYGFFMLCEGFFQIRSDIPPWFIWVYYMGFHTYAFRAAVVNEFKDRGVMDNAENPSWQTGLDILKYYDMEDGSVSDDCWTLFGYCLAFFTVYYIALVMTTGKR